MTLPRRGEQLPGGSAQRAITRHQQSHVGARGRKALTQRDERAYEVERILDLTEPRDAAEHDAARWKMFRRQRSARRRARTAESCTFCTSHCSRSRDTATKR